MTTGGDECYHRKRADADGTLGPATNSSYDDATLRITYE